MIFEASPTQKLEYVVDEQAPSRAELLIYHHGTPAAGPIDPLVLTAARNAGLRTVSIIRPGYGQSTRRKGRMVADIAPLAGALATHLGHDRFVTAGWSGGGPHTIATTALLTDRCPGAVSIAGVAPFGMEDLDFLNGMGQDNIEEFGAALAGESELDEFLTAMGSALKDVTGDDVIDSMASLLPEADRELLRSGHGEVLASELRWSVKNGIDGWFDDDIAFVNPWGFDLNAVGNKVIILQGSDDLMVPFAHGQWLARNIPSADARLIQGEGHLSIGVDHLGTAMRELRALLD